MRKVIEASAAVAIGAQLCRPKVIPLYPITPQTHIVEHIAELVNNGELASEVIHCESEHSAISAAIGAQATGVRTFTATASQGLALMHEILFVASGMRLPIVMAVANRTLSAPINIWNDHQDSISERDSGWIQLYVESGQEALDTTIQAFRIGEGEDILLPVMICLDGFNLSHVFEPVDIPKQEDVDALLPPYTPVHAYLEPERPISQGPIGPPEWFMHFKEAQERAMQKSIAAVKKANQEFKKAFGRGYGNGLFELYRMADASTAIVAMGSMCGTARVAVDSLREKGEKVGLIKLRCYRPFPAEELAKSIEGLKDIAAFDKDISPGMEGALYTDLKAAMYAHKKAPKMHGFIVGLGGRSVTEKHFTDALHSLAKREQGTQWLY